MDFLKFSFVQYELELNKVLHHERIINDLEDFWKFVTKYESIKRNRLKGQNELSFKKTDLIEIKLKPKIKDLIYQIFSKLKKHKTDTTNEFLNILIYYLDFKQKEYFSKLKKLRKTQQNLPIYKFKNEIVESIQNNRVIIIAGDTGCGKSTQVPQYLLQAGYNRIAVTQPRRLACISLCKRVKFETLTENSQDVGYKIRFESESNKSTKVLFLTEGLLLRQISAKESELDYDVIIIDEVHERHLFSDFLLGILKCLLYQNLNLKIVLMSATININLFQNYFSSEDAKLIQVPGRLYPIELNYRPIKYLDKNEVSKSLDCQKYLQIMQIIDEKYPKDEKGDLLIFLSGSYEIKQLVDAAKEYNQIVQSWIILPLHSTLSLTDQDKVFAYPPENIRKCIISTNIAETSLTIDGVRFVIDSGKVKQMNYDNKTGIQKLKEFWISKASAEQRKGRAGRTGPGVCFRLYSEEDYNQFDEYTLPEILKVPIDNLLLQMISMGLPDVRKFPFIEPPQKDAIDNSLKKLKCFGTITENETITLMGKTLAQLPVDITIGKMLVMGSVFDQIETVFTIAAIFNVQNPLTDRAYRDKNLQEMRKELESNHGDAITLLNIYREWLEIKNQHRENSRKWCKKRGLEEQRLYEITKLREQFKQMFKDSFLIDDESISYSSQERAKRYGEVNHLKYLKREYNREQSKHKNKRLKFDLFEIGEDEDKSDEIDIKDINFRLQNDQRKIKSLLDGADANKYKDLLILKLIICSGLYPQIAIADEYNYCKSKNEQLFHTLSKNFVSLHPDSYYSNNPECLQLNDDDIEIPPDGYFSNKPFSGKHQLLCYLKLLETTKIYLMHTMRVPAAQTLLLLSQKIETNSTITEIVCDSWLKLEFPMSDSGQIMLIKAAKVREKWDFILKKRLEILKSDQTNENNVEMKPLKELELELENDLVKYFQCEVVYTISRLLPADLKKLYNYNQMSQNLLEISSPNPFNESFKCIGYQKGGIQVAEFIYYSCLIDNEYSIKFLTDFYTSPWQCNRCEKQIYFEVFFEILKHRFYDCKIKQIKENRQEFSSSTKKNPNLRSFECHVCKKTFELSPVEILKHKKQHEN